MCARPTDTRGAPANLDAERSVLGAILLDNTAVNPTGETFTPEDSYGEAHRVVFIERDRQAIANFRGNQNSEAANRAGSASCPADPGRTSGPRGAQVMGGFTKR